MLVGTIAIFNEYQKKKRCKELGKIFKKKIEERQPRKGNVGGLIRKIIRIARDNMRRKILVCAPSNNAVDNLMEKLMELKGDDSKVMIRVGQDTHSEKIKKFHLNAEKQNTLKLKSNVKRLKENVEAKMAEMILNSDKHCANLDMKKW